MTLKCQSKLSDIFSLTLKVQQIHCVPFKWQQEIYVDSYTDNVNLITWWESFGF